MERGSRLLPEIEKRLERYGVTCPSRDWLIRAMHPAGETPCPGFPDESAVQVMRPQFRTESTISAPSGSPSWDLMLITIPGDVTMVYWGSGPAGTDFTGNVPPPGCFGGAITIQPSADQPGSIGYLSSTAVAYNVSTRRSTAFPQAFRHMYASMTLDLIAAAVSDQGEVYSAQFPPNWFVSSQAQACGTGNTVTGYINAAVPHKLTLPLTESDMALLAPDYYSGQARDGVYVPLRFAGPTNPFVKQDVVPLFSGGPLEPGLLVNENGLGSLPVIPFVGLPSPTAGVSWISAIPGAMTGAGSDTGLSKMNSSVTIFRGLAGSAGVFPSSVKVKLCVGLELMPYTSTPDRVYAQPALAFDPRTLEAYYAAVVGMRDAYPASYNGFGEILSTIAGVAKSVWPAIRSIGNTLTGGGEPPPPEPPPPPRRLEYRVESEPVRPAVKPRAPSVPRSVQRATTQRKVGKLKQRATRGR